MEQFVVFLWALELMIPLQGVTASYAVVTAGGEKTMVKADAGTLLDQHRGRVIPADAPDRLRFQLAIDERPLDTPPLAVATHDAPANALEAAAAAETAPAAGHVQQSDREANGRSRHHRCCGSCGCVVM